MLALRVSLALMAVKTLPSKEPMSSGLRPSVAGVMVQSKMMPPSSMVRP